MAQEQEIEQFLEGKLEWCCQRNGRWELNGESERVHSGSFPQPLE
jgi:hypothetical protein